MSQKAKIKNMLIEFSETPNRVYFLRKLLILYTFIFLLGILIYAKFF